MYGSTMFPPSERQLQANRDNAQKSTGPRTYEGRKIAARNALRHGIRASQQQMLIPGEAADELREFRIGLLRALDPRDELELTLVEQIIWCDWKLRRVRAAEHELYGPSDTALLLLTELDGEAGAKLRQLQLYEQRLLSMKLRCHRELRVLQNENQVGCLCDFTGEVLEGEEEEAAVSTREGPAESETERTCETPVTRINEVGQTKPISMQELAGEELTDSAAPESWEEGDSRDAAPEAA